jgi:molybdenum storage protein
MQNLPAENILDLELFHAWTSAKNLRRVQIVNGLVPGQLTRALRGEDVGTVIVKEAAGG